VIFSRISYAVYLTQFAVFFYNVGSIRASEQFSLWRSVSFKMIMMMMMIVIIIIIIIISTLWTDCLPVFG